MAVDETRIYRLNSTVEGWIREAGGNSHGSVVKKDETLATIYSPEFLAPQQAYLYMLTSLDRFKGTGQETPSQIQLTQMNVQQNIESLRNLGMSDLQIKEIEKTRRYSGVSASLLQPPASSWPGTSPRANGSTGVWNCTGWRTSSRVWVLVDLFENEAQHIHPGEKVKVTYPYQKKTFEATVSEVLPIFDPTTRTLKVPLELDNPDYLLRPDMFVDVNFPVKLPPWNGRARGCTT